MASDLQISGAGFFSGDAQVTQMQRFFQKIMMNNMPSVAPSASPLVSIIIPMFKSAAYLREQIAMLKRQTYPWWEAIYVDDNSPDGSAALAEDLTRGDARFRVIRKKKRTGFPSVSRNLGIEAAVGEFICFLDHDDLWHREKLRLQALAAEKFPQAIVISTAIVKFAGRGPQDEPLKDPPKFRVQDPWANFKSCKIVLSSAMVPRQELIKIGGLADSPKFRGVDDYHLWLRLAPKGDFVKVDEKLCYWRTDLNSLGSNKTIFNTGLWNIYEDLKQVPQIAPKYCQSIKAQALRTEAAEQLSRNACQALSCGLKSFQLQPSFKTSMAIVFICFNFIIPRHLRPDLLRWVRS